MHCSEPIKGRGHVASPLPTHSKNTETAEKASTTVRGKPAAGASSCTLCWMCPVQGTESGAGVGSLREDHHLPNTQPANQNPASCCQGFKVKDSRHKEPQEPRCSRPALSPGQQADAFEGKGLRQGSAGFTPLRRHLAGHFLPSFKVNKRSC